MKEIKVLIKGAYGVGNLGDDMLMIACNSLIKKVISEEKTAVLSHNAKYLKRLLPDTLFIPISSCAIRCDLLVFGGGTQFFSFPLTKKAKMFSLNQITLTIKSPLKTLKKIYERYILKYRVFPQKYAALGLGFGPFIAESVEEIKTKKLLKKTDFIAVRDINSLEICRNWGIKNALLRTDLCFIPEIFDIIYDYQERPSSSKKRIGVIVRDWPHSSEGNSYIIPIQEAIKELRSLGFEMQYVLFNKRDKKWIETLINDRESFILWEPEKNDMKSFFSELHQFDAFITARYHGAVFSAILKKPVICIEIEPKLYHISKLLENGSELWNLPFNSHHLVNLSVNLFKNYKQRVSHLNNVVNKLRSLALMMEDEFKNFINCI